MTQQPSVPVAVIVDGYSSGNFLPAAFARLGADVVHVQSTAELMPSMLAPNLAEYRENHVAADPAGVERVLERLRALGPVAVLAGQEPGVPLADLLAERLGLPGNGSALSRARRDKFRMIETVRAAGLRCARQFKSSDVEDVVQWARSENRFPVVVKPLSSASTDNVYVCRTLAEVARAASTVLSARDIFDLPNTEALIQSYLDGVEYIVDTVSVDGRHHVVGVWQYEKQMLASGKNIYDRDVLQDPRATPVPELVAYIGEVLDALNIRQGASHAEVMVTAEGPALVELGARLNGNMNPGFHDICIGANQADLMALAYVRPDEFLRDYADRVYTRRQHAAVHNTSTALAGVVESVDETVVDKIAGLPSVHLVSVKLGPGSRIRPTVDLLSSPLRIFMTGTGAEVLRDDHRAIGDLKERVYRVRPA